MTCIKGEKIQSCLSEIRGNVITYTSSLSSASTAGAWSAALQLLQRMGQAASPNWSMQLMLTTSKHLRVTRCDYAYHVHSIDIICIYIYIMIICIFFYNIYIYVCILDILYYIYILTCQTISLCHTLCIGSQRIISIQA